MSSCTSPHEDWQPEQKGPEPENHQKPKDTKSEKQAQLPHEKKSRLTPGDIEAIKAMRANPQHPRRRQTILTRSILTNYILP